MWHLAIEAFDLPGSALIAQEENKKLSDVSDELFEFLGNLLIPLGTIIAIVLFF